ncbi:hypothetical protein PPACK8108_LOCUS4208 [Phakopsora pachyrhizi]|uniref:Uncharacterized protein n=1 Tax=Phakopsora pachyrhizi TaxID=170000 RepID=A0AAV0ALH5_PHAPC|nr:hypothetical protein PPACK8108_LOCUS4208 [Phakopsora pachyrhizi]
MKDEPIWSNSISQSEIESNKNSKAKERKSKLKEKLREKDWERNDERLRVEAEKLEIKGGLPSRTCYFARMAILVLPKLKEAASEGLEKLKQEPEYLKQKIEDFNIKQRQKLENQQLKKEQEKKRPPKLIENKLRISKWERVIEIAKKGKLEALKDFFKKKYDQLFRIVEENEDFSRKTYNNSTRGEKSTNGREDWLAVILERVLNNLSSIIPGKSKSLLQIGCVEDHTDIVEFLLVDYKSDATIKTDLKSLTAYELCTTKATSIIFWRATARLANWFDWKNDCKGYGVWQRWWKMELRHRLELCAVQVIGAGEVMPQNTKRMEVMEEVQYLLCSRRRQR